LVNGTTTERHDQHAEIIEVCSQDGSPPYVVRWLVTDHEATVPLNCTTGRLVARRGRPRTTRLCGQAAIEFAAVHLSTTPYPSPAGVIRTLGALCRLGR
jgi:hypothetical protein